MGRSCWSGLATTSGIALKRDRLDGALGCLLGEGGRERVIRQGRDIFAVRVRVGVRAPYTRRRLAFYHASNVLS